MDNKKEQKAENRKRQLANIIQPPVGIEKSTVIVLIIAAVVFVGMFFYAQSFDVQGSIGDGTGVPEDGMQFERGTVTEILSDNKEVEENTEGSYRGTQELSVVVKSGQHKGETLVVYNYFGPNTGVPVEVGDSVVITIKEMPGKKISATVYEFNRIPILVVFLLLFFLAIVAVGGRTGIRSLIGLVFTVICLFFILIPLLQRGAPMVPATFAMCAYIALVSFTILGGVHRKTISAFLGTVAGAFLAMVFGLGVQYLAKIDGLRIDEAEPLLQLKYMGFPIHLRGLLVAGIIVSALGAVMDIAMSISSAMEEIYAANPTVTKKALFRSGMNIGRDMVGTMTNTLILAFLGSEFTLIILLYSAGYTFYHIYSTAFVSLETVSGNTKTFKKILKKKLRKGTYYKFIIVALDKNNKVVSTSKLIHVATKGGKFGNHKSVTVKKTVLTKAKRMKVGGSLKLNAKAVPQSAKKKVKKHVAIRYESTNKKVATVNGKGVVKARKKGTCYVYAYAQSGVYKRIKVIVK